MLNLHEALNAYPVIYVWPQCTKIQLILPAGGTVVGGIVVGCTVVGGVVAGGKQVN